MIPTLPSAGVYSDYIHYIRIVHRNDPADAKASLLLNLAGPEAMNRADNFVFASAVLDAQGQVQVPNCSSQKNTLHHQPLSPGLTLQLVLDQGTKSAVLQPSSAFHVAREDLIIIQSSSNLLPCLP